MTIGNYIQNILNRLKINKFVRNIPDTHIILKTKVYLAEWIFFSFLYYENQK
jgi:hypothetical protein